MLQNTEVCGKNDEPIDLILPFYVISYYFYHIRFWTKLNSEKNIYRTPTWL